MAVCLPCAEVLRNLNLHEEKFQVLDGHVLMGGKEVRPVIRPTSQDYLKGSNSLGGTGFLYMNMETQRKERTVLTSAGLRIRFLGFGLVLISILL